MTDTGLPISVRVGSGAGVRASVAEHAREALDDVVGLALEQVTDCIAAALSLTVDGQVHTISATGQTARVLDRIQYREQDGPCLAALRAGEPVACDDYGHERRWPAVAEAARAAGVASSLSIPLLPQSTSVGALNLYSRSSGAFDTRSRRAAQSLARHGAAILDTLNRAYRDPTFTPADAHAPDAGGPAATQSEEPAEKARALTHLLALAERVSGDICTALPPKFPAPNGSRNVTASAQRCLALIQDALTVGAIELATLLGIPDDQLPD